MDIMGTLGPWALIIIVGLWILFMTQKRGWKWPQIIAGVLLVCALYSQFPTLPQSINSGMTNIYNSIAK
jgi:glycopeptide antibiotics resistance protein